ncbi:AbfB domain-containing protein [Streptomyces sp. NPDC002324]
MPTLSGFIGHATVLKETVDVTLPVNTTQSLRSVDFPDRYAVVRSGKLGYIEPVSSSSSTAVKRSATLTVVPGLADAKCCSFRESSGRYMRHWNFRIRFDAGNGTGTFDKDATFCARAGSTAGSVSLESYNYPGRYIRHYAYALRVDTFQDTAAFRADSSFTAVSPWAWPVRPTPICRAVADPPATARSFRPSHTRSPRPRTESAAGRRLRCRSPSSRPAVVELFPLCGSHESRREIRENQIWRPRQGLT